MSSGEVQPAGSFVGLAGVNVHRVLTVLALHGAAPPELTLALCDALHPHRVVAPPTAHDLAAVRPPGRLVADPPGCSQRACRKETTHLVRPHTWLDHTPG